MVTMGHHLEGGRRGSLNEMIFHKRAMLKSSIKITGLSFIMFTIVIIVVLRWSPGSCIC
jgi:hypothetical protein